MGILTELLKNAGHVRGLQHSIVVNQIRSRLRMVDMSDMIAEVSQITDAEQLRYLNEAGVPAWLYPTFVQQLEKSRRG